MKKKKKKVQWNLKWTTAHSGVESRCNALYRDRQGWEERMARQVRPRYGQKRGHDTAQLGCNTAEWKATIRPGEAPRYGSKGA